MGSKATLYIDRGRYELIPQHRSGVAPRERLEAPDKLRGLDFYDAVDGAKYHLENWIDCVRSRAEPSCPVEEGVASANLAHAANAALPGRLPPLKASAGKANAGASAPVRATGAEALPGGSRSVACGNGRG